MIGKTNRASVVIGTARSSWRERWSFNVGQRNASKESGVARLGPRLRPPVLPRKIGVTSLSPPSPQVRISAASTMVCQPPTKAPSFFKRGVPLCKKAISVVVPPISATKADFVPARNAAPERLAAGPDKTVSTGRDRAKSA